MNIKKLFEMQRVLDERNYKEHDLKNKYTKKSLIISRILALIVEAAECANEHREFKFWSVDQEPRTKVNTCEHCKRNGMTSCCECEGKLYKNLLLEEYVDGLHFIISLGLEIDYEDMEYFKWHKQKTNTISEQFIVVIKWAAAMLEDDYYFEVFHAYIHLGTMLGFTWEEIEQAYMDKNKVNHQRQDSGY